MPGIKNNSYQQQDDVYPVMDDLVKSFLQRSWLTGENANKVNENQCQQSNKNDTTSQAG